jgi:hypothetical protein
MRSVQCISAWDNFSGYVSQSITGAQVQARFGSLQNLMNARAACDAKLAGRDHLTIGLLVLAAVLGLAGVTVYFATRRTATGGAR